MARKVSQRKSLLTVTEILRRRERMRDDQDANDIQPGSCLTENEAQELIAKAERMRARRLSRKRKKVISKPKTKLKKTSKRTGKHIWDLLRPLFVQHLQSRTLSRAIEDVLKWGRPGKYTNKQITRAVVRAMKAASKRKD